MHCCLLAPAGAWAAPQSPPSWSRPPWTLRSAAVQAAGHRRDQQPGIPAPAQGSCGLSAGSIWLARWLLPKRGRSCCRPPGTGAARGAATGAGCSGQEGRELGGRGAHTQGGAGPSTAAACTECALGAPTDLPEVNVGLQGVGHCRLVSAPACLPFPRPLPLPQARSAGLCSALVLLRTLQVCPAGAGRLAGGAALGGGCGRGGRRRRQREREHCRQPLSARPGSKAGACRMGLGGC